MRIKTDPPLPNVRLEDSHIPNLCMQALVVYLTVQRMVVLAVQQQQQLLLRRAARQQGHGSDYSVDSLAVGNFVSLLVVHSK